MRTALLVVCVIVAWAACAAAAEVDAPGLFASLDGNADGRLTSTEAGANSARLFTRLLRTSDDDGDGELTADEFAAALTPVRADKALVEKQGSRLPGGDALVVLLAKMDANGDRRLVADEIPEQFRRVFETMLQRGDADKNGRLDSREIAQAGPQLGLVAQRTARSFGIDVAADLARLPQAERQAMEQMDAYGRLGEMLADPEQAAELFARLDANGDQKLSADEAPEGIARLFRRGDRDDDGQLSEREFLQISRRMAGAQDAPAEIRSGMRQLLNRFDRDGDGAISRNEAPRRLSANFDRLDRNGDGLLQDDELPRAEAGRGRRPGPRPNGQRPAGDAENDESEMSQ